MSGSISFAWTQPELEFAQEILRNGGFPSDVAFRVSRKFKTNRTARAVYTLLDTGKLNGYGKTSLAAREATVIQMRNFGWSIRAIGDAACMSPKRAKRIIEKHIGPVGTRPLAPKINPADKALAHLYVEDPIREGGVSLLDLQANSCRFPIARNPDDKSQMFCGEQRAMSGLHFASAYCPKHRAVCTQQQPLCEAAE